MNEVERPAKDLAGRPGIEPQILLPGIDGQIELVERLLPTPPRPVVEGQRHAIAGVPHAVHEPQRRPGPESFQRVVLDENAAPRDASRFAQELTAPGGGRFVEPDIAVLLEDVRTRGDRQHPFWAKIETPGGRGPVRLGSAAQGR